eukprot:182238-Rhodomonas_salina.1
MTTTYELDKMTFGEAKTVFNKFFVYINKTIKGKDTYFDNMKHQTEAICKESEVWLQHVEKAITEDVEQPDYESLLKTMRGLCDRVTKLYEPNKIYKGDWSKQILEAAERFEEGSVAIGKIFTDKTWDFDVDENSPKNKLPATLVAGMGTYATELPTAPPPTSAPPPTAAAPAPPAAAAPASLLPPDTRKGAGKRKDRPKAGDT